MTTPIQLSRPSITEEEVRASERVLRSGWLVHGPECRAFEEELAEACGRRHAVVVSSGTAALHLCLLALYHRADAAPEGGDGEQAAAPRLLVPAFTFPATANVARFLHPPLSICLADVDADTFCVSPDVVSRYLELGHGPILAVHQFGFPAPLPDCAGAAHPILSDAACAIGARGAMVGRAVCLSFHPRKVLTTGEGGAVLTDDDDLAQALRELRAHGLVARPGAEVMESPRPGLNYRMPEMAAAIGRVQLRRLPALRAGHEERAMRYRERLLGRLPMQGDAQGRTWQTLAVVLPEGCDRMALRGALREAGIETQIASYGLHRLGPYRDAEVFGADGVLARPSRGTSDLPVADRLHDRGLALPLHAELPLPDVDRVCDELLAALDRAGIAR